MALRRVRHLVLPPGAGRGELAWRVYVAVWTVTAAVYACLPGVSPGRVSAPHSVVYILAMAATIVSVVVGVRWHRPRRPFGWLLAAAAVGVAGVGRLIWDVGVLSLGVTAFGSVSEVLYLLSYPIGAVALVVLIRRRSPGRGFAGLLDVLIVLVALAQVSWTYLAEPTLGHPVLPLEARLHGLAAPLFDAALIALTVRLATRRASAAALRLVVFGLVVALATDALNALNRLPFTDDSPGPLDVGWMTATVMLGAAALHPSMRLVDERAVPRPARLSRARIAVLMGVALAGPTLLSIQAIVGRPVSPPVLLGGTALLFALVLARMGGLAEAEQARADLREQVLGRIVAATEQERSRIAADLDDGPIQQLSSIAISAEVVRRRFDRGDLTGGRELLPTLERRLGHEIRALRRLMVELRPPVLDEWGLAAALEQVAAGFADRTGIPCHVRAGQAPRLDASRETVVYRVTQEALNNVAKHAAARQVWIVLEEEGRTARLEVRDDGVGFRTDATEPPDTRHFGLVGLRQRVALVGGTVEIRTSPGKGTAVTVHLPLSDDGLPDACPASS